jgi:arylformamidase
MQQDSSTRGVIAALGTTLGPEVLQRCSALFAAEQRRLAAGHGPAAVDLSYGPHPRHRLDLYVPSTNVGGPAPIFVWVHGGGFVRGEKSSTDHPFNAHVGNWVSRNGFLGVVINYRLVPDAAWPSGGEDAGLAVDWVKANVARHGGDPGRIILAGTSAGSVHIATFLQSRPRDSGARGAVLLSGLYGATPMEAADKRYFGEGDRAQAGQASLQPVADAAVPLFVACAEFDPPRFQAETVALLQAVLTSRGRLPRSSCGDPASSHPALQHSLAKSRISSDRRVSSPPRCIAIV